MYLKKKVAKLFIEENTVELPDLSLNENLGSIRTIQFEKKDKKKKFKKNLETLMAMKVYEEMKKKNIKNKDEKYVKNFINFSLNDEIVKNNLLSQVEDIQSKLLERKKKSTIKGINNKVSNLFLNYNNQKFQSKSFSDNEKTILSNSSKNMKNIKIGDKECNLISPDANFLLEDKMDGNISPFSKDKKEYFEISGEIEIEMEEEEDLDSDMDRKEI